MTVGSPPPTPHPLMKPRLYSLCLSLGSLLLLVESLGAGRKWR